MTGSHLFDQSQFRELDTFLLLFLLDALDALDAFRLLFLLLDALETLLALFALLEFLERFLLFDALSNSSKKFFAMILPPFRRRPASEERRAKFPILLCDQNGFAASATQNRRLKNSVSTEFFKLFPPFICT